MDTKVVQIIRDLARPFLTVWFSLSYTVIVVLGVLVGSLDAKEALLTTAGLLGTILGYHFGKSARIDGG